MSRSPRTQDLVPALQLEGVSASTQVVDVGAQQVHALQTLRHHHLLLHQVRLGQVGAGLGTGTARDIRLLDLPVGTSASSPSVMDGQAVSLLPLPGLAADPAAPGEVLGSSCSLTSSLGRLTSDLASSSSRSLGGMTMEVLRGMM